MGRPDSRALVAILAAILCASVAGCHLAPAGTVVRCETEDPTPGAVGCEAAVDAIRPHIPPGAPVESVVFNVGMRCPRPDTSCPYTPFVGRVDVQRVDGSRVLFSVTSHDGILDIRLD